MQREGCEPEQAVPQTPSHTSTEQASASVCMMHLVCPPPPTPPLCQCNDSNVSMCSQGQFFACLVTSLYS